MKNNRRNNKNHTKNTLENIGLTITGILAAGYFTVCFIAWNAGFNGLTEALTVWF